MGAGVLYHLAHLGWTDCILIEKAELTSGATWHAAGLVSRMVGGHALGSIHDYAVDLYKKIEKETDVGISWHNCGSLRVATSPDHMAWINHIRGAVLARGQEAHIIDAVEVARLNPLYDVKAAGVIGALHTPDDGHVDPSGTCQAMAKGARQLGAKVRRNCLVTGLRQLPSGEWQVETEQGTIIAEHVVNAAGYHARQVGAMTGLDLPITTMLHHYVVTDAVPEFAAMDHEIPVTRDDYFCGYVRREQASALIGLYDKQDPQSVWLDGCPWDSTNELFDPNWDGITPWLENCFERMPALMNRGIKRVVNGGITYTPDGAMLLGPAPGLRNYWWAGGATVGIAWGPGAGRAWVQWMVDGSAEISTRAFDPRRFGVWADADYARARATEDYTLRQAMPYPQLQRESCREIRVSGVHERTKTLHAVFEEAGGWERPRVYGKPEWEGKEPHSWKRGPSWEAALAEARAVHEGVGIGDFSAFSKFEITGPEAEAYLNRLCANRMPKKVGGTCLTLLLNEQGTIEGEATIARLSEDRFWFVTGGPSERRVWDWITVHQRGSEDVIVRNLSDGWGILTVAGPKAREVLAPLSNASLENADFGWLKAREMSVAGVDLIALRLSFSGELAWELHASMDQLGSLWDAIWQAGQPHDMVPFGSKALEMMRMEKAYRGGHELANNASPVHTDQMRFVKLDKDFVGKDAVVKLAEADSNSVIAYLDIEMDDTDVLGGEAVFLDREKVGSVSSGSFGPVTGRNLAFAFVKPHAALPGKKLSVIVFGQMHGATVLAEPVLDPQNTRLRDTATNSEVLHV